MFGLLILYRLKAAMCCEWLRIKSCIVLDHKCPVCIEHIHPHIDILVSPSIEINAYCSNKDMCLTVNIIATYTFISLYAL